MPTKLSPEEALWELNKFMQRSKIENGNDAFAEAAAVLLYFDPLTLHPFQVDGDGTVAGWIDCFNYCDPVRNQNMSNAWQLRSLVRRQALQRLSARNQILQALQANPNRIQDRLQQLYETILAGQPIDVASLKREELVAVSMITEWLHDILPVASLKNEVQLAIPIADLLAPLNRLAGSHFTGRIKELSKLAKYVGISTAASNQVEVDDKFERNVPLLVYGPGGVGKSTLIGKFILEEAGYQHNKLPFMYLDTDRAIIEPKQPETYFIEAAQQLAMQCPTQREALLDVLDNIRGSSRQYDLLESSKSFYRGDVWTSALGSIIVQLQTPVLLVLDTFEEAQFLGPDIVSGIWTLLDSLQKQAPNLRIIVSGRNKADKAPALNQLLLQDLDRIDAKSLIADILGKKLNGVELEKASEAILAVAGTNPMSLRLALTIVEEQGVDKLKKVETRNWFMRRVKTEIIQARLYGRILSHIHNDKIKQLAYPGLIVRRITADVVREILAGPCKLTFTDDWEVEQLVEDLAKEGALVSRDPLDGALYHRQDVRLVMLQDLKAEVSVAVIKNIHDNAVTFYSKFDDTISRAEEIYHRLGRGDDTKQLEERWMPGIENRLRTALEELPASAGVWLASKLGVTIVKELLQTANLSDWESIATTSAERYLASGQPQVALETLRERDERTTNSPLYRLELEALRSLGLYDEAAFVADEMLTGMSGDTRPDIVSEINIQAALVKEAQGKIRDAYVYLLRAAASEAPAPTKEGLRLLITQIRLLRKMSAEKDAERSVLMSQATAWLADEHLLESLRNTPALFREVVAELGKVMPGLIENAIDWMGIELRNEEQVEYLSQALINWDTELQKNANARLGELSERAGLTDNTLENWNFYINANQGKKLSRNIQHWRKELQSALVFEQAVPSNNFDKALVDIYRKNVDLSINRDWLDDGGLTIF